ncbi:large ribosomal subunit protein uL18c-like [Miscanthus floridulus]|uniref:large ribosomal subunit protein uL18c-like n=1 Tax=Miscanthus floridulus TaxID=154761 RepID=UPI00345A5B8E
MVSTPQDDRIARHVRLRKKVSGTTERPRLSVFRSNKHLYAQVIDDTEQCTLASASTMHKTLSKELEYLAGPTIGPSTGVLRVQSVARYPAAMGPSAASSNRPSQGSRASTSNNVDEGGFATVEGSRMVT